MQVTVSFLEVMTDWAVENQMIAVRLVSVIAVLMVCNKYICVS